MSLINKLTQKIKYAKPSVEMFEINSQDVITTSKQQEEQKIREVTYKKEPSFFEKYPNGLPLEVLELIDFKRFGAILKQKQLLPPSYDRKPIKVEIDQVLDQPRVILTFKSTTSESKRKVSIYGYSVACSAIGKDGITILEVNHFMSEEWKKFAEHVMWAWERGYNYALVGPEKNLATYRKPRVNTTIISDLQEIEEKYKNL